MLDQLLLAMKSYLVRGPRSLVVSYTNNVQLRRKDKTANLRDSRILGNLNPQKIICLSFRSASWRIPTRQTDLMDGDLKSLFDCGSGVTSDDIIKRYLSKHTRRDFSNYMMRGVMKRKLFTCSSNSRRYIPSFSENKSEGKQWYWWRKASAFRRRWLCVPTQLFFQSS